MPLAAREYSLHTTGPIHHPSRRTESALGSLTFKNADRATWWSLAAAVARYPPFWRQLRVNRHAVRAAPERDDLYAVVRG